jgi:hypothetical protein
MGGIDRNRITTEPPRTAERRVIDRRFAGRLRLVGWSRIQRGCLLLSAVLMRQY